MKEIRILAIESSCDETAAAVVKNGNEALSNIISSQIDLHAVYGGVVPEIASRKHVERIDQVVSAALYQANMTLAQVDAVAVTYGPGLVGALLVGLSEAKALAFAAGKPLVGVHHIEGHMAANYVGEDPAVPPYLALVVSGGHTHLVWVKDYEDFEVLGRTRDDAAGEAYDKVARAIGMGYPGGPKIDRAAQTGNSAGLYFPRPEMKADHFDFSFSGLKSAVLNYLNQQEMKGQQIVPENVAAAFQEAVVEVLVQKAMNGVKHTGAKTLALSGGVSSNGTLRREMAAACEKAGVRLRIPPPILCTDNAVMIGAAAYHAFQNGRRDGWDLNANPSLQLGER